VKLEVMPAVIVDCPDTELMAAHVVEGYTVNGDTPRVEDA
jgi:hypothetical protein